MRISIVTNAYNQGRYLRRCMESVLRQPWENIEYIVIDPGSNDETGDILREYEARGDSRLIVVRERDSGPADGLNKGFARATGDWFSYMNADDFYLRDALKSAELAIKSNPGADCIYGDGYITDAYGVPVRRAYSLPFTASASLFGYTPVLQQSTFYRAESFRKVGGFNVENRTSWDYEILVDMSREGMSLVHTPGFWSAFAIYGESITGSQRHAAESIRNHDRIFHKVMGRERTSNDLKIQKRNVRRYRILHPLDTLNRILDEKWPTRLPDISSDLPSVNTRTK